MLEWMLAPVMRAWAAEVSAGFGTVPRPAGPAQAHSSGADPYRFLLFGNGPVVGWGVTTHELALPGQIAREFTRRTGRGVDAFVQADPALSMRTALDAIRDVPLAGYDAIVVTIGLSDAARLTGASSWRSELRALMIHLSEVSSSDTRIVIAGIQPVSSVPGFGGALSRVADSHAQRLNRISAHVCSDFPKATFFVLPGTPRRGRDRHRTPDDYQGWGQLFAEKLAAALRQRETGDHVEGSPSTPSPVSWRARDARDRPQDEASRQRSLDRLGILNQERDNSLDRIVALARSTFGTAFAAITLIDDDRQVYKSSAGFDGESVPRETAFCNSTIQQSSAMVVADASKDSRFAEHPLITNDAPVRFYAGFPIEAPDGARIGALCVFDPEARDAATVSESQLRDLALMVQREFAKHASRLQLGRGEAKS